MMNDGTLKITDACFAAGFNNVSNFNRQSLKHKAKMPSRFRALHGGNAHSGDRRAARASGGARGARTE